MHLDIEVTDLGTAGATLDHCQPQQGVQV